MQQTRSSQQVHLIRRAACDILADPKTLVGVSFAMDSSPIYIWKSFDYMSRAIRDAISRNIRYHRKFPTFGPM